MPRGVYPRTEKHMAPFRDAQKKYARSEKNLAHLREVSKKTRLRNGHKIGEDHWFGSGTINPAYIHGHKSGGQETPTHSTWLNMRRRCSDTTNKNYKYYGGRGIIVCERWQSFENFLADMGEKPTGKTLDRINNELGYFPGNCHWATATEQARNKRTSRR